jgi:hypothetical protein
MRPLPFLVRAALLWCVALVMPGCIDSYMPDAISSTKSYLVVDGFINSRGSSTFLLSRTSNVDAKGSPPIETRAQVYIEEEGGPRYSLQESAVKGTYISAVLTLNTAKNYRLRVLTSTGKDYASDYVPVKITPAIDAVTWRATDAGLTVYVNSHDDTKQTQYYRYEYEETWEIMPPYSPSVEYKNGIIQNIVTPFPTMCWGNNKSTSIALTNTTRLTQDVVSDFIIRSLSATNNLLSYRYSILVKQYAQTSDEYMYWELLKKNTESIGSLFDPLPAQLTGNITCLNDESELALGFVGAHSVEQKRLFIARSELPRTWRIPNGYETCVPPDTVFLGRGLGPPVPPAQVIQNYFGDPNYLPISPIYNVFGGVSGYLARSRDCIDCRTRGTAVKPSFWP